MKIGFVLTTYDRIDDCLAHIDILKYYPFPHEVIPIWMLKDSPEWFVKEMKTHEHAQYVDGVSFRIGPLLGLVAGIRKAHELGLDYIVYRNGDDWLFNHDFVHRNFMTLEKEGKHVAGYNWLSNDSLTEFALNEMYLRVDKFMETVDEAEHYFRTSSAKWLCELKMARWVKRTIDLHCEGFYRLPDREFWPGVGYEVSTMAEVLSQCDQNDYNAKMTPDFWEKLADNSRFFNRKWQLIGSHSNHQRFYLYNSLRDEIPYAAELEKEKHFSRWGKCFDGSGSGEWNLPSCTEMKDDMRKEAAKLKKRQQPLMLKPLPKKMPKKFISGRRRFTVAG